jgi:hypothetical protein
MILTEYHYRFYNLWQTIKKFFRPEAPEALEKTEVKNGS